MEDLIQCFRIDVQSNTISKFTIPGHYGNHFRNGIFSLHEHVYFARTVETAIEFLREKNDEIVANTFEQIAKFHAELEHRRNVKYENC